MTASSNPQYHFVAYYQPNTPTRTLPHGLERLVTRVSIALLTWARKRGNRLAVADDAHARRIEMARMIEAREHHDALRRPRAF